MKEPRLVITEYRINRCCEYEATINKVKYIYDNLDSKSKYVNFTRLDYGFCECGSVWVLKANLGKTIKILKKDLYTSQT